VDGIAYYPGSIDLRSFRSLKADAFREAFELNVVGAVRCLQAVERNLKKSAAGSVVLFSTVAVQRGMPFHAAIASAKGAVEGLTRSLAAEYAPSIRVNAIAPSLTDTPLAEKLLSSEDKREASAKRHPLNRVATAGEIAGMAAYLLSDRAAFMTGQVIGMDGGLSVI
jgi:NAD(P)-dependent dehydrogenase (short-subunit alcohol dehydrogenase family)